MIVRAFKLMRRRKDGTLGPLFCNARQRVPVGRWLRAGAHRTPGLAFRPGWHATPRPHAPHLSKRGRVWVEVSLRGVRPFKKPEHQGGLWLLAREMRVERVLEAA